MMLSVDKDYLRLGKDQEFVEEALANDRIRRFVYANLQNSLKKLGFRQELIDDLLENLRHLDLQSFWKRHRQELDEIFTIRFLRWVESVYFGQHVIPLIRPCNKIIDVGCGTGTLAKLLSETGGFHEIVGIEIDPYPEWAEFSNAHVRFELVRENELEDFLKREGPDAIVLTWVLHHMDYDQQARYMQCVYDTLKPGAQVIILEDAYSTTLTAEEGVDLHRSFMAFTPEERHAITGINDWTANRVLGQRAKIPVPFGYRTLEDWETMFSRIGYRNTHKRYLGFPDRDVYNPQSTMVFQK